MSISDLLDTPPSGSQPAPRLTPRSPLSIKEVLGLLALIAGVGAFYREMSKYAEKTTVDKLVDMQVQFRVDQIQLRADMNHGFDVLTPKVDQLVKAQDKADLEKKAHK